MIVLSLLNIRLVDAGPALDLTISFDEPGIADFPLRVSSGMPAGVNRLFRIVDEISFAVLHADDSDRFNPTVDVSGDTARDVVFQADLQDGSGKRLRVRYRVELLEVDIAPPLRLRPRPVLAPVASAASVALLSVPASSVGATTIRQTPTLCYIAQPTNYTGDKWHIGAALALNPNYRVIILKKNQKKPEKDAAAGYARFYERLGVAPERILHGAAKAGMRQIGQSYWPKRADEYAEGDAGRAERIVRMTFASTSGILRAVEERGPGQVVGELRAAFLGGFTDAEAQGRIRAKIAFLESCGPCVLVNMRCSHYHFEHNITEAIYRQIERAATARGITVIRVGIFEAGFENHERFGAWMRAFGDAAYAGSEAGQRFIDVYGFREARAEYKVDELETAYLWSLVARLPNVIGVIGGRSGSLDIAAFMGVRVLSWDIVDNDVEYIRMFLAYPLMSCCRRTGLGDDGRARPGKQDPPSRALLDGLLDPVALDLWLSGNHVIPEHLLQRRLPRAVVERDLEFEPLRYLDAFLGSARGLEEDEEEEEEDLPSLLARLPEETLNDGETLLDTMRYGTLAVGDAVDDGNCFFDSLWQLLPPSARGVAPADLRTLLADTYRNTLGRLADADRVRGDRVYVSPDDIRVMANAIGREIVIHICAYGSREAVPMQTGPAGAGTIHVLLQTDPDGNGHISPLRPAV